MPRLDSDETIKLCIELLLDLTAALTQILSEDTQTSPVSGGATAHRKHKMFSSLGTRATNLRILYNRTTDYSSNGVFILDTRYNAL